MPGMWEEATDTLNAKKPVVSNKDQSDRKHKGGSPASTDKRLLLSTTAVKCSADEKQVSEVVGEGARAQAVCSSAHHPWARALAEAGVKFNQ